MLRHLLTSAARTSSRLLFTKPNASAHVFSLRMFSDKNASTGLQPLPQNETRTNFQSLANMLCDAFPVTLILLLGIGTFAKWNRKPMEESEIQKLHKWLKRHDIHAECTEEGVRRGLSDYSHHRVHIVDKKSVKKSC